MEQQGVNPIPLGYIQTVLGPVAPADLGVTHSHEHLIVRGGVGLVRAPGFTLDSVDKMVEELASVTAVGARTVVDMIPLDAGRQPADLVEISQRARIHVIAATGFHSAMYYDDDHWVHSYRPEQLVDLIVAELLEGMDRRSYSGPIVERLPARAGVIKLATEYHYLTPTQRKLIGVYGAVHQATGFPISTHTENGTLGDEQVRLLSEVGVPTDAVLVGHMDRLPDLGYHKEVAASGAYLIYDGPSRAKYGPDSQIIALITGLLDAGYGKQLLLGSDFARKSYLRAYGGGPGLDYLLTRFLPRLRREGVPAAAIDDIMIHNPARAFGRRPLPGESA